MTRLRSLAALTLALGATVLAPRPVEAQSTREELDRARALYEAFQIETARPIYLKIISATYTQQLSAAERAEAYKYLGASAAVLASNPEEAITYFQGALDYDPFTDLDPAKFAPAEQAAFAEAKRKLFKVAMKPLTQPVLIQKDTAEMSLKVEFITTQRANVTIELMGPDTIVLFQGFQDGPRSIPWSGVHHTTGQYAKPGVYQLRMSGFPASGNATQRQEAQMVVRIEHVFETLEEPLPPLDTLRQLLPPRIRASEPWFDIAKGSAVAALSVGVPLAALDANKISWAPHAGATAVAALSAAAISYWYRTTRPEIQANVRENARRQQEWAKFNADVETRNRARLDRTKLVVSPVTGIGQ